MLLKAQKGRYAHCGLFSQDADSWEIDNIIVRESRKHCFGWKGRIAISYSTPNLTDQHPDFVEVDYQDRPSTFCLIFKLDTHRQVPTTKDENLSLLTSGS